MEFFCDNDYIFLFIYISGLLKICFIFYFIFIIEDKDCKVGILIIEYVEDDNNNLYVE